MDKEETLLVCQKAQTNHSLTIKPLLITTSVPTEANLCWTPLASARHLQQDVQKPSPVQTADLWHFPTANSHTHFLSFSLSFQINFATEKYEGRSKLFLNCRITYTQKTPLLHKSQSEVKIFLQHLQGVRGRTKTLFNKCNWMLPA